MASQNSEYANRTWIVGRSEKFKNFPGIYENNHKKEDLEKEIPKGSKFETFDAGIKITIYEKKSFFDISSSDTPKIKEEISVNIALDERFDISFLEIVYCNAPLSHLNRLLEEVK